MATAHADDSDYAVIRVAQIEAMLRLLVNSGDVTPMGVRLLQKLWEKDA